MPINPLQIDNSDLMCDVMMFPADIQWAIYSYLILFDSNLVEFFAIEVRKADVLQASKLILLLNVVRMCVGHRIGMAL